MRYTILLVLIIAGMNVSGQTIPNGDFEDWASYTVGAKHYVGLPKFWNGTEYKDDGLGGPVPPPGVSRSTDHFTGKYSAMLSPNGSLFPSGSYPGSFRGKLTAKYLNGHIKTSIKSRDSFDISVCDQNDTNIFIFNDRPGKPWWGATKRSCAQYTNWTPFHLSLFYPVAPSDSFCIYIDVTWMTANQGYIKIDSLYFSDIPIGNELGDTPRMEGITTPNFEDLISIFPNPATTSLSILNQSGFLLSVQLYDAAGRCTVDKASSEHIIPIGVAGFTPGIYCCVLAGESFIIRKKIIIE